MDENFRDATYHLRWAGRHALAGFRATAIATVERVRAQLPGTDRADVETATTQRVPDRIVNTIEGARRRVR